MQTLKALYQMDLKVGFEFERLLKEAAPAPLRLHQLVKTFHAEVPDLSNHEIERRLLAIYALNYHERTGTVVSRHFGIRPYPWLMGQLLLNFSNAIVSETKKYKAATTINHVLGTTLDLPATIVATQLLHEVVHRMTKPRSDQKKTGLRFDDFIERWQQVCFRRFGDLYDSVFTELNEQLTRIESTSFEIPTKAHVATEQELNPLELSQTDLDWMKAILDTISEGRLLPLHPLSRGPKNPNLVRVETLVRTLRLLPGSKHGVIKATIARTCTTLLKAYGQAG